MNANEVMQALAEYGNAQTKRIYQNHGAVEPLFGVKVGDLKKLKKRVGRVYELALELFDSGNADAQYLAALCADEKKMTEQDLRQWAQAANWYMLSEYAVAQLISETEYGWQLGLALITSHEEHVACCGWATLGSWLSFRPHEQVDVGCLQSLLERVEVSVHTQPNRLRYAMCNFVVAVGAYVPELTAQCLVIGQNLNGLEIVPRTKGCSIPEIVVDLTKIQKMGRIGKKRKRGRC